jgi:large conductance mechanosensitive channel
MGMLKEFRDFIARGNVLGMAVGLLMGVAFGAVVTSFANDILMQLIAAVGAKPDFSALAFEVNDTPIRYGSFLTALTSFVIISYALFLVVKAANRLWRKEEAPKGETELDLLKQIRDELRARNRSPSAP